MRLLILDDDPRLCETLASISRRAGWEVDTANVMAEFEHHLAMRPPDAVVLDLRLGPTDGVEVLRCLARVAYPGCIILMSGFDDRVLEAARGIGMNLGLDVRHALEKPVRASAFAAMLRELAARQAVPAAADAGTRARGPEVPCPAVAGPDRTLTITPAEIDRAREEGELALHFQPIVAGRGGRIVSLEALVRWFHPGHGTIGPDRFIPVAETDAPAMERLTGWVIDRALAQRHGFLRAGIDVPIAVNISGVSLHDLALPDRIAARVAEAGFQPSALSLEITEGVAVVGAGETADILTRLRLRGFDVAIDDLGAGYASLQALLHIPFSYLKVDKSLVCGIGVSRDAFRIVRAIAELAHGMSLRSVAEGVESAEIARMLVEIGIDALQGAWLSMPLAQDALIAWARARQVAMPVAS